MYAENTALDFFPDERQTPARREARNHRSEDAGMLGPPPCADLSARAVLTSGMRAGTRTETEVPKITAVVTAQQSSAIEW